MGGKEENSLNYFKSTQVFAKRSEVLTRSLKVEEESKRRMHLIGKYYLARSAAKEQKEFSIFRKTIDF